MLTPLQCYNSTKFWFDFCTCCHDIPTSPFNSVYQPMEFYISQLCRKQGRILNQYIYYTVPLPPTPKSNYFPTNQHNQFYVLDIKTNHIKYRNTKKPGVYLGGQGGDIRPPLCQSPPQKISNEIFFSSAPSDAACSCGPLFLNNPNLAPLCKNSGYSPETTPCVKSSQNSRTHLYVLTYFGNSENPLVPLKRMVTLNNCQAISIIT